MPLVFLLCGFLPHVSVAVEEPDETLLGWLDDNNLTLYHLGLQEGGAPWDAITVESITDALEVPIGALASCPPPMADVVT